LTEKAEMGFTNISFKERNPCRRGWVAENFNSKSIAETLDGIHSTAMCEDSAYPIARVSNLCRCYRFIKQRSKLLSGFSF